jgi:hypothetical protein
MIKKTLKKNILEKLVRDNAFHKIIANNFECSERRVEQWFYRALRDNNVFGNLYNHIVITEMINYLSVNKEELFE